MSSSTELMPATAVNGDGAVLPHATHAAPGPRFTFGEIAQMAEGVALSGLLPGITNPQQAMALLLLCDAEGLHPMHALKRYHIIEGRPSMRADCMQAEFQQHGGRVEWVHSDTERCEAVFYHPTHAPTGVAVTVTFAELDRAGVTKGREGLKKNWKQFPRQMLRARAISEGVRMVLPGVVAGIYTPEETQDFEPVRPSSPARPEPARPASPERARPAKGAEPDKAAPPPWPKFVGGALAWWDKLHPGADARRSESRRFQLIGHLVKEINRLGGMPDELAAKKAEAAKALEDFYRTSDDWRDWMIGEAEDYVPKAAEEEKAADARRAAKAAAKPAPRTEPADDDLPPLCPPGSGDAWEPDGAALRRWAEDVRRRSDADVVGWINHLGRSKGWPDSWREWGADQVEQAHKAAVAWLREVPTEEAIAN